MLLESRLGVLRAVVVAVAITVVDKYFRSYGRATFESWPDSRVGMRRGRGLFCFCFKSCIVEVKCCSQMLLELRSSAVGVEVIKYSFKNRE